MPNSTIDLRKLKDELKGRVTPENELPEPPAEPLLETEEAAHPEDTERLPVAPGALLEWDALEFDPDPGRSVLLFLFGLALLIGSAVVFFLAPSFLFAVFLLIAGGLAVYYAFRLPRPIRCAITPRGVKVEERLYEFDGLQSFWVFYDPPLWKELSLLSRKTVMPYIRIPLGDLDPVRLREVLLPFLPEERQEESPVDIFAKHLGL